MNKSENQTTSTSRRDFIKKLAYMPPAIATLTVLPAFHASGSGWNGAESGGVSNGIYSQQQRANTTANSANRGFGNVVGSAARRSRRR